MLAGLVLLWAQQSFGPGLDVELGTLGASHADHATVAINQFGDIVVADHADFTATRKLVEATVIRCVAPHAWETRPPILLGDPQRNVFGSDLCHKPDVAALGDGSFAVVWARFSSTDPARCRLETAQIITRDAQGRLYANAIVKTRAAGEGWVVDDNLNAGVAGVMPDVSADPGNPLACFTVYAHEESSSNGAAGVVRNYAVRTAEIDWSKAAGSHSWLEGPWILGSGIGTDNRYSEPLRGGQVLPDVLFDDDGFLVVAWEEYWLAEHPGRSGGDGGDIRMRRFEKPRPNRAPVKIDDLVLLGTQAARPQRRPMMSSTELDGENRVLIAWNEDLAAGSADQIRFQSVVFNRNGAPGYSGPTAGYWVASTLNEEALPRPLLTSRSSICFATRDLGNRKDLEAGFEMPALAVQRMLAVPISRSFPNRPAMDILEVPRQGGGPLFQTIVITYEGANTRDQDTFKIHLWITES